MKPINFSTEYPVRLRAAVIGCGSHAKRNIFPAFQYAPIDLVGACDINETAAASAAQSLGTGKGYTDYRRMLEAEKPDVVFVVLNYDENAHPRYPAVAAEVMRAGSHVWIEKPPAATSTEVRRMMEVSKETNRFVGVGFKKMFVPANVRAKQIISKPEFGSVSTITARYPQSLPLISQRSDDRQMLSFLDHIMHPYSVLRFFGGPIESLQFESERTTGASLTTIRFTSGALGSLHLSAGQSGQGPFERTEILGNGCSVLVDNNIRVTYYRRSQGHGAYGKTGSYFDENDEAPLFWEPEFSLGQLYNKGLFLLGYAPEIIHFCECMIEGKAPEAGNLDDALELMKVYEAYQRPEREIISISERV